MKALRIILLPILMLLITCKSDDDIAKIIYPGPYFPVYPDSWWKYLVNDSLIVTDATSEEYILHKYTVGPGSSGWIYSDPAYVPFLNGQPIYKYDRIAFATFGGCWTEWPILSETVGYSFDVNPPTQYHNSNEKATVKAKIFNGRDSVLIIVGIFYTENTPGPSTSSEKRYREYVKDVGLASDMRIDTITHDTVYKKTLIDYHISFKK
jgi:hypothetical protein